jgi:hypothetical protein
MRSRKELCREAAPLVVDDAYRRGLAIRIAWERRYASSTTNGAHRKGVAIRIAESRPLSERTLQGVSFGYPINDIESLNLQTCCRLCHGGRNRRHRGRSYTCPYSCGLGRITASLLSYHKCKWFRKKNINFNYD